MKKLFTTLISALTLGAALPAVAGPDWATIEHARKMHHDAQVQHSGDVYEALPPTAAGPQKCPAPEALVLPLDHGPRAQSTPYLNQQRKDRYDAQIRACKEASK